MAVSTSSSRWFAMACSRKRAAPEATAGCSTKWPTKPARAMTHDLQTAPSTLAQPGGDGRASPAL